MLDHSGTYYDRQEVRAAAERELAMFNALPGLVRHAIDNAPWFAHRLAGVEPDSIASRTALAGLPVLRREELARLQREQAPFGGLEGTPRARLGRMFAAPGPVYVPEGIRSDYWRLARALFAAGLRAGDVVHNSFPCELDPTAAMLETGARALGCPVVPAGAAPLDRQLQAIAAIRPKVWAGPSAELPGLLDAARHQGLDLGSITTAVIAGEPLPTATRDRLQAEFGVRTFRFYATPELGLVAYETAAGGPLVIDESLLVEIVRPGTGEPLPHGESGEIVVTAFNPDFPLLRFAPGDRAALLPGESPCGRTNLRLGGLELRGQPA